jgi:hypothetical protein
MPSLAQLTASSQITCPVPLPASAVACLEGLLARELRGVEAAALRLGRGTADAHALRLACSFQQLLQPPLRQHCEYHASAVNARGAAVWPVSGEVCVPVAALQSVGAGGLALPGLARARAAAGGGAGRGDAAEASAPALALQAGAGEGAGGAAGGGRAMALPTAKRARAQQAGAPLGFED